MNATISTRTGHFAMFQTATALSPTPTRLPASSATGPVSTTATALALSSTSMRTVTPRRTGSRLRKPRPSSVS